MTQLEDQHTHLLELESDLTLRTAAIQQNVLDINVSSLEYFAKRLNGTPIEFNDCKIAGDHVRLDTAEAALKQWIVAVVEKDVMRARVPAAQKDVIKGILQCLMNCFEAWYDVLCPNKNKMYSWYCWELRVR